MSTASNLSIALALVVGTSAVGCVTYVGAPADNDNGQTSNEPGSNPGSGSGSGSGSGNGSGDGSGDGSGSGSGSAGPPLQLKAIYRLDSKFDIAAEIPGTAGAVINGFIDATDGPNDPTDYLLTLLINQVSDGTLKDALTDAKDVTEGAINDELESIAPQFLQTLLDLGNDFGQVARGLGISTRLSVANSGSAYTAVHTMDQFSFVIDGNESDFSLADYGLANTTVTNVGVTMSSTGGIAIAEHQMPVKYGALLHIALDNAVLPLIDPTAYSLTDVFNDNVDCDQLGQTVADAVGVGDAGTYSQACTFALEALADYIYSQIDSLDQSAMTFDIAGTARGTDSTGGLVVDTISHGTWTGTLEYGTATPGALSNATFTGATYTE